MTVRSDGKPEPHHRYESDSHPQIPTHTPRFFPGEVVSSDQRGLTEREGFEPSDEEVPVTGFRDRLKSVKLPVK